LCSNREAEPEAFFLGREFEAFLDLPGRELAARRLDHAIKVHTRQIHPFMADVLDAQPPLEQLREELLGRHRIIRLEYAKERKAFGKPIVMHQAIAFKLANMATEIDAARLLIWRAAWLARNGGFKNGEGSMSKYKASEVAVRVTEDAIQILGGYGYTREYPVERWHRDAKIHTIFEGTSEIQQLVIARAISGLRIE